MFAFLTLHAIVIVPIWWSVWQGLPFVLIPSLAIAPAFHRLVRKWWQGAFFGLALWISIVPASLLKDVIRVDAVHFAASAITAALLTLAFRRDWRSVGAGALAGGAMLTASAGPLSIFRSVRAVHLFFGLLPVCVLYGLAIGVIAFASSAEYRQHRLSSAR